MAEDGEATGDSGKAVGDDKSEPVRPTDESSRPSADKRWGVRGAIAAAAITAVVGGIVTVVVALISHSSSEKTQPPTTTSIAPAPPAAAGPAGSITKINADPGGDITISGVADPGVTTVIILIARTNFQYWASSTPVAWDLTWTVKFASDQHFATPLKVMAYFRRDVRHDDGSPPEVPACTTPECLSQLGPPAIGVM
jgi:hypothetical protein